MSSQTGPNRAFLAAWALVPLVSIFSLAITGCGHESQETSRVELLTPSPGQISGDPISIPDLTDLNETAARPVVMRFGDGTLLVQRFAGGKVEIIPTPDPDKAPGKEESAPEKNPSADAKPELRAKVESIPVPEPTPDGSTPTAVADGPEDYKTWQPPDVALVVTGRQHGYIEPCGCTGLDRQKGGMARRFTFLRELRENGWTLIPVDAGDQVRRFGQQAEIKLQQTVKALQAMDYQAVGFGPDDLRLGVGELLSVAAAESPEEALFVSANVVLIDPALMPTTKIVERNGIRVGLTSILDPDGLEVKPGGGVVVGQMAAAAREAAKVLQANQTSFRVMLFFGKEDSARKLVQEVAGFDLIVVAGGYGEPTFKPLTIEGSKTQMIVTGNKGMYAGLVGLYSDQPMKYARVPLTHEFSDAPEMRKLMSDYQEQLRAIGLDGLGLLPAVPHSSGQKFVGSAICGNCHTEAMAVWEGSAHAEATSSIVQPPEERGDVARHFDPECLSCHVTGWNPQEYFPYESGYLSLDASQHLTGSGCENCHGPGSKHAAAEEVGSDVTEDVRDQLREAMRLPLDQAREKCMSCHDLDNSPDFHDENAFEDIYWPEVEHYGTE